MARVYRAVSQASFKKGRTECITPEHLQKVQLILAKEAQQELLRDIQGPEGKYSKRSPIRNSRDIWVVGRRLIR